MLSIPNFFQDSKFVFLRSKKYYIAFPMNFLNKSNKNISIYKLRAQF